MHKASVFRSVQNVSRIVRGLRNQSILNTSTLRRCQHQYDLCRVYVTERLDTHFPRGRLTHLPLSPLTQDCFFSVRHYDAQVGVQPFTEKKKHGESPRSCFRSRVPIPVHRVYIRIGTQLFSRHGDCIPHALNNVCIVFSPYTKGPLLHPPEGAFLGIIPQETS